MYLLLKKRSVGYSVLDFLPAVAAAAAGEGGEGRDGGGIYKRQIENKIKTI